MIRVGIIGGGRHAEALRAHATPLGSIVLTAPEQAEALLVFGDHAAAVAGLRAGKTVLCAPPAARTQAELAALAEAARAGGGRLLPGGEIVHSETGKRGLATIAAPEFGAVKSIWLAIRQARGGEGDVVEALGWEALDFVLAALPGGFATVRTNAGALFGAARDTAVILLRSESDVVVTIELARCLPATLAPPGLGEIEIEVMGAQQSVRIQPGADAVQVWRDDSRRLAPWLDAPVLEMLRRLEAGTGDGLDRAARALAVMARISAG